MAFMQPAAERFAAYHVETTHGTEIVPEEICGALVIHDDGNPETEAFDALRPYLEGSMIYSWERKEGWYARLSAPGYLDCTGWDGPYDTAELALAAVKEFYEVDDNGDDHEDQDAEAE
jgi:hypothetical protein